MRQLPQILRLWFHLKMKTPLKPGTGTTATPLRPDIRSTGDRCRQQSGHARVGLDRRDVTRSRLWSEPHPPRSHQRGFAVLAVSTRMNGVSAARASGRDARTPGGGPCAARYSPNTDFTELTTLSGCGGRGHEGRAHAEGRCRAVVAAIQPPGSPPWHRASGQWLEAPGPCPPRRSGALFRCDRADRRLPGRGGWRA